MEPDVDGQAAIATRKRIMDQVATDRTLAAGMHMHFPGFLNLNRRAERRLRAGARNMATGALDERLSLSSDCQAWLSGLSTGRCPRSSWTSSPSRPDRE